MVGHTLPQSSSYNTPPNRSCSGVGYVPPSSFSSHPKFKHDVHFALLTPTIHLFNATSSHRRFLPVTKRVLLLPLPAQVQLPEHRLLFVRVPGMYIRRTLRRTNILIKQPNHITYQNSTSASFITLPPENMKNNLPASL